MRITIDGPSGAGKSTLSKKLAEKLGFKYIDTGAMYRAIGLKTIDTYGNDFEKKDIPDEFYTNIDLKVFYSGNEQREYVDGVDITDKIRTPEVSMAASFVAKIACVREKLVKVQREVAGRENVIMDGRDAGTFVLPDAEIKLFLTASTEDRAQRRYEELIQKGIEVTYEDVLSDVKKRDKNDSSRAISPLRPADDAIIFDSSGNTFDETFEELYNILKEKVECTGV